MTGAANRGFGDGGVMTTHSPHPTHRGAKAGSPRLLRVALPVLATVAIVAPLGWLWQASRVPAVYSVMEMGYLDYGGGAVADPGGGGRGGHMEGHVPGHDAAPSRLITDMVADPARPADVRVELVTRQQTLTVDGRSIPGFTVNGTSPGPEIRALQGQLIEVQLRNESVIDGVTLHWHGVDVPNAMDGVAGVTQDAVPVGGSFTYRFVADQVGSYWYHSHQVSNPQVAGGLLGSLVVTPTSGIAQQIDVSVVAHTYGGIRTINGNTEDLRVPAQPGQRVRVRVSNTDNAPMKAWTTGSYRLLAIDGTEVHQPTVVTGRSVTLTAGARADLEVKVPSDGTAVRVQLSKATAVIIGPPGADPAVLRHTSPTRLQPGAGHPPIRLPDRSPTRLRQRPARDVVVHQWASLSECPDVRGTRGRRGGDAHREPQR
jgi:FtsP/CotA-like multicopper oxidase with cupredoxin domain